MIKARVLTVKPHPAQDTSNPGCWAVQFRVSHAGRSRTFWRWYASAEDHSAPSGDEILDWFWRDTFNGLHGFDFSDD